jgi:hypothetical protein
MLPKGKTGQAMKHFLLTLVAQPQDDGSRSYSTSILQDQIANRRTWRMDFVSEAAFRSHVSKVTPNLIDVDHLIREANKNGYCSIDSPIEMNDQQAARYGWIP